MALAFWAQNRDIQSPSRGKTGLGHGTARQPEAGGWEQVTGQLLCLMFYALLHGYEFLLVATTPKMSIYMMTPLKTLSPRCSDSIGGVARRLNTFQPGPGCSIACVL